MARILARDSKPDGGESGTVGMTDLDFSFNIVLALGAVEPYCVQSFCAPPTLGFSDIVISFPYRIGHETLASKRVYWLNALVGVI